MKNVCLVCEDRVFARMLELEMSELPIKVKSVCEKKSKAALSLACSDCDLVVFDADYSGKDLSFVEKTESDFIVFSHDDLEDLPKNVTAFFERPFSMKDYMKKLASCLLLDTPKTVSGDPNVKIELDQFSKQATVNGRVIKFSPKEFLLLQLLYKNRGAAVSRKEVLDTIWGKDYDPKNNADNVYINYLRKKLDQVLGFKLIHTVRGKGYMMK